MKFTNENGRHTTRLQNWDYRAGGSYFVTICTKNREHYFGEIINGIMSLSNIGVIADILLHELPNHHDNIALDEYVVMPNHIHVIITIKKNNDDTNNPVGTGHALSLPCKNENKTIGQQRFQNIGSKSLSSIVGSFKSATTKHVNRLQFPFAWQTRFYEHIIRDEEDYKRIREYIMTNESNWDDDRFNGDFILP